MSFFKNAGKGLGAGVGLVLGGSVKAVGKAINNDFVQEIGDAVDHSMQNTGDLVGNLAEGIADVGAGTFSNDEARQKKGLSNLGTTTMTFGSQVAKAAGQIVEDSAQTIDGLREGDMEKAKRSGKNLAKVAAVSIIAIGVVDVIDGADATVTESDSLAAIPADQIENPNTHDVSPHERVLANGEKIWVDGDGDTSIDRETGWIQTNPNYHT